ncbi:MAG: 3-ketoacyl-ACP reductase [Planctomycetota bacterium]
MTDRPVAIVTGGTRGIGLAIAQKLASDGFDVAVNGRRPEADITDSLESIRANGARALYLRADVSDLDGHALLLDTIREHFGRLDCLVNNAGVAPESRLPLTETTPESFDRVMSINLRGPFFLTQACANWMLEQRETRQSGPLSIINVSSVSATVVSTNRGEYCLSKAGVAMATQLFAADLAGRGIGVYEVRPGVIRTDMTSGVTEKYDKLFAQGLTVEPRWGEPIDVARAVATLARGELTYAAGQVLTIDGGLSLTRL